jgi:hypothetical protein
MKNMFSPFAVLLWITSWSVAVPGGALAQRSGIDVGFERRGYTVDRYANIWEKSPFEIDIVEVVPAPRKTDLFKGLALVGYTRVGSGYVVTLVDTKTNERQKISFGRANHHGLELVDIVVGETVEETEIRVRNGVSEGTVGFRERQTRAKASTVNRKVSLGTSAAQRIRAPFASSAPTEKRKRVILPKK